VRGISSKKPNAFAGVEVTFHSCITLLVKHVQKLTEN